MCNQNGNIVLFIQFSQPEIVFYAALGGLIVGFCIAFWGIRSTKASSAIFDLRKFRLLADYCFQKNMVFSCDSTGLNHLEKYPWMARVKSVKWPRKRTTVAR